MYHTLNTLCFQYGSDFDTNVIGAAQVKLYMKNNHLMTGAADGTAAEAAALRGFLGATNVGESKDFVAPEGLDIDDLSCVVGVCDIRGTVRNSVVSQVVVDTLEVRSRAVVLNKYYRVVTGAQCYDGPLPRASCSIHVNLQMDQYLPSSFFLLTPTPLVPLSLPPEQVEDCMMINCTIKGGVRGKGFIMYNVVDNTGDIIEMAPGDVRADVFSVPDKHTPMRTNFLTTDSGKAWKEELEFPAAGGGAMLRQDSFEAIYNQNNEAPDLVEAAKVADTVRLASNPVRVASN